MDSRPPVGHFPRDASPLHSPPPVLPPFSTLVPPLQPSCDLLSGLTAVSPALSRALAWSRRSECAQGFHIHRRTPDPPVSGTPHSGETPLSLGCLSRCHPPPGFPSLLSLLPPPCRCSFCTPRPGWMSSVCLSPLPSFSPKHHYPGPWRACLSPGWWLCLWVCIPAFRSCPLKPVLLYRRLINLKKTANLTKTAKQTERKARGFLCCLYEATVGKSGCFVGLFLSVYRSAHQEARGSFRRPLDKRSYLSYKINA